MNEHLSNLLTQIKRLSPMPDDDDVTDEQLDEYAGILGKISDALEEDRDLEAIPVVLASLGYPDGYGLYQGVLLIMAKFSDQELLPHLIDAVQHAPKGGRQWAALYLGYTKDPAVVPYLLPLLNDPEEHVRAHTALALSNIGDPSTRAAVAHLSDDPSLEVRETVETALEDWPE